MKKFRKIKRKFRTALVIDRKYHIFENFQYRVVKKAFISILFCF